MLVNHANKKLQEKRFFPVIKPENPAAPISSTVEKNGKGTGPHRKFIASGTRGKVERVGRVGLEPTWFPGGF